MNTEKVLKSIDAVLSRAATILAEFSRRLLENPAYAFEYGDAAVRAAATREVFLRAKRVLAEGKPEDVEGYPAFLRQRLVREAQSTSRSTSDLSNQVERAKVAALADLVEIFEGAS